MKATLSAVVLSLVVSLPALAQVSAVKLPVLPTSGQAVKKINLNTADAHALTQSFKGIGQKRAEAIVNYRTAHGEFKSVAQLAEVRGFGKAFVNGHLPQLQAVFAVE